MIWFSHINSRNALSLFCIVESGGKRDFDNQPMVVTFPPSQGSDSMSAVIGTIDDFINEDREGFLLSLNVTQIDSADEGTGINLIREGVALVTINDNDSE